MEVRMPSTALTVMHKHIRREMFDFSMRLFRTGSNTVAAMQEAFDELLSLLRTHAAQEETRLEPLLRSADPNGAAALLEDHRKLEAELDRIAQTIRSIDARSPDCAEALLTLHLDWNRYLANYLIHLDTEERAWFADLTEQMPLHLIAAGAAAQGAEGRKLLDRLWSVTTPSERAAIEHATNCAELAEVAA
jgi:hypothetical protein